MRKVHRRNNKSRVVIISVLLVLTLCFTIAYSAFSTNLSINTKGNVKEKPLTVKELLDTIDLKSIGDGLYKDTYTNSLNGNYRYIYKGVNPDNYIVLENGGDTYRIISFENDYTIKVIKNETINTNSKFSAYDPGYSLSIPNFTEEKSLIGTRYTDNNNDYCYCNRDCNDNVVYAGCNIWGSRSTTLDEYGNSTTSINNKNLPEKEAFLNIYLNDSWYSSLPQETKKIVIKHNFKIGPVSLSSNINLKQIINEENKYQWNGYIGLKSVSDYILSSAINTSCKNVNDYINDSNCYSKQGNENWLYLQSPNHTITPDANSMRGVIGIFAKNGVISNRKTMQSGSATNTYGYIYPVFYISANVKLIGKGTKEHPYQVIEQ